MLQVQKSIGEFKRLREQTKARLMLSGLSKTSHKLLIGTNETRQAEILLKHLVG